MLNGENEGDRQFRVIKSPMNLIDCDKRKGVPIVMKKIDLRRVILPAAALVLCIVLFYTSVVGAQSFKGRKVTFTITGSVGPSGVEMKGFPEPVVTDEDGNYSATVEYGWRGTVRPTKEGYTFEPTIRSYEKITGNLGNEDYTATLIQFTISGTTGKDGVVMNGLPGNPVTGTDGTYSATVDYGWSGTITPTKEGYTFKPANRVYDPVTGDQMNQNYTGTLITFAVSGATGIEGVVMNGLPGNPITGVGGLYNVTVNYGWSGTVTPVKEGYTFEPPERQYSDLTGGQFNQSYAAKLLTFTISGSTGMAGVVMEGLPGNPVTDTVGDYTATVDYAWRGTVTPTKESYTFEPANRSYKKVTANLGNEGYTATLLTFTISGSAGTAGVVMNGLPDNPVTGTDGTYSATVDYGWLGTITPTKEGYTFKPANKIYDTVTADQMNQNYTGTLITFTVSGTAGVGGVVMSGLPGNPVTATDGRYTAMVNYGFSGTATPTKEGYTFEPSDRQYSDVTSGQTNQNYTATLLKRAISGTVTFDGKHLEGVSVSADKGGGSGLTDDEGRYQVLVDYGWSGTVTPEKEGYTFKPTNKVYGRITRDQTNQAIAATLLTFTISGVITIADTPIEGVLVSAEGAGSDVTDAEGKYSVTVSYGWSGAVAPTKEGYIFDPPSKTYTNVTHDITENGEPPKPPEREVVEPEVRPELEVDEFETERKALQEEIGKLRKKTEELSQPAVEELIVPEPAPEVPEVPEAVAGQLISNFFVDVDLRVALQDIASQVGVSIIPDETVTGMVSCELKEVPLDRALEMVLASTGYVVKKTPHYYMVCSADPEAAAFSAVSETRLVKMNYAKAATAVKLLSTGLRQYVVADDETGTACITAPPFLMDRIISDLKMIDRRPRHVMLNARIVVMERGDLLNLGVEWAWPTISAGLFSSDLRGRGSLARMTDFGGKFASGIQIGYTPDATFTNSLELALNLLESNDEATILAEPQVLAQDRKEAQINVITEEYYMMTSPEMGLYYTRSELEKIESGTKLNITPYIGDNNDITLDLAIEVSNSIPRGRGSDLPVVTRRTSTNTVRIKDGGTVAVAGLTENRTRLEKRSTPGLSNIPILGNLFKSKNDEEANREIAVFVTARLISESESLTEFTKPPTEPPPVEPVGEEFKKSLKETLSRLRTGDKKP